MRENRYRRTGGWGCGGGRGVCAGVDGMVWVQFLPLWESEEGTNPCEGPVPSLGGTGPDFFFQYCPPTAP